MADVVSEEAFERHLRTSGLASDEQIAAARELQAKVTRSGGNMPLSDAFVVLCVITPEQRERIEKKLLEQHAITCPKLGRYKLIQKLGQGAMGTVFLAEEENTGRTVALKILPKKMAENQDFLARFQHEANAVAKLDHPNIVRAFEIGSDQGHYFYVMEYCEGEDVRRILKRERCLSSRNAIEIAIQVARGLRHAHDRGLVHRDIKPANIFVTANGVVKILDLGLAKNVLESEQAFHTQTGVTLGTPHYMSPEQSLGDKSIDGRSDIYSLGATLYHMTTGLTPFDGPTTASILLKHLNEEIANPQDIIEDMPDGLAMIIQKMMAKKAANRYRDCKDLGDDLQLVADGQMPQKALVNGASSIAARKNPKTKKPPAAHPAPTAPKRGTSQHGPVTVKHHDSNHKPHSAEKPHAKTGAIKSTAACVGGAIAIVLVVLAIMGSGGDKTTKTVPEKDVRVVVPTPPPRNPEIVAQEELDALAKFNGLADTDIAGRIARLEEFDKRRDGTRAAIRARELKDRIQRENIEVVAQADFDKLTKFDGLSSDDLQGRIARLEEFSKQYGATLPGARARSLRDSFRNQLDARQVMSPERWQNSIDLIGLRGLRASRGNWRISNGRLITESENLSVATLEFPYQPPAEYDILVSFTRERAVGWFQLLMTRQDRSFNWGMALDSNVCGFEYIGDDEGTREISNNVTRCMFPNGFQPGHQYSVVIQVRDSGLKAFIDGQFMKQYNTDYHELNQADFWSGPRKDRLGLSMHVLGSTVVNRCAVLEVGGRGAIFQPPPRPQIASGSAPRPDANAPNPESVERATPPAKTPTLSGPKRQQHLAKVNVLLDSVLKEAFKRAQSSGFGAAITDLDSKLQSPTFLEIAPRLKAERSDIKAVLDLRAKVLNTLSTEPGKKLTVQVANVITSATVLHMQDQTLTVKLENGMEMPLSLGMLPPIEIDKLTPPATQNRAEDLRVRGLHWMFAGYRDKARDYFGKAGDFANDENRRDLARNFRRLDDLDLAEKSPTAWDAWLKAEALFADGKLELAVAAYEKFQNQYGESRTWAFNADTLRNRLEALDELLVPRHLTADLGAGITLDAKLIQAGTFMMGDGAGTDQSPAHVVQISRRFYMSKSEITVAQFRRFADAASYRSEAERTGSAEIWRGKEWQKERVNWRSPGLPQNEDFPACIISWNDAKSFCNWASVQLKRNVRLPTEAEWEYACRAGTATKYCSGNEDSDLGQVAWYWRNAGCIPKAVCRKSSNAFGLFDMHGNVWEWCEDWYKSNYYSESPKQDPKGPESGTNRVLRGGCCGVDSNNCTAFYRSRQVPTRCQYDIGFRVVVEALK